MIRTRLFLAALMGWFARTFAQYMYEDTKWSAVADAIVFSISLWAILLIIVVGDKKLGLIDRA